MFLRGPACPSGADAAVLHALAGQPAPGVCSCLRWRDGGRSLSGSEPGRWREKVVGGA